MANEYEKVLLEARQSQVVSKIIGPVLDNLVAKGLLPAGPREVTWDDQPPVYGEEASADASKLLGLRRSLLEWVGTLPHPYAEVNNFSELLPAAMCIIKEVDHQLNELGVEVSGE
jgi:hypothetical protein